MKKICTYVAVTILLLAIVPSAVLAKGPPPGKGETEVAGNNLSFPAIAVDGFSITPVTEETFYVVYAGEYPGLTADEIAYLEENGAWYPQQTEGNKWQAEYANQGTVDVTYIDWSDNMESISPKIRSPFRLEMVLFKALDTPMTAYTMAVLEYPSSADELQGTNATTYEGDYATVISDQPKLVIQYLGNSVSSELTWDGTTWVITDPEGNTTVPDTVSISFAPELNVGGKYVFGASSGGWKPAQLGYYRITFYIPAGSGVNLASGTIANAATGFTAPTEGVATAVLDTVNNLTYIDVLAVGSGGGGRK
jgi:hypothetical protein